MERKEEDIELVNNVQEDNCQQSLKELINRHSALCYNVYQRYGNTLTSSGVCFDDVVKEKDYIIYKSAMSYNPEKNTKFTSLRTTSRTQTHQKFMSVRIHWNIFLIFYPSLKTQESRKCSNTGT